MPTEPKESRILTGEQINDALKAMLITPSYPDGALFANAIRLSHAALLERVEKLERDIKVLAGHPVHPSGEEHV